MDTLKPCKDAGVEFFVAKEAVAGLVSSHRKLIQNMPSVKGLFKHQGVLESVSSLRIPMLREEP